MQFAGKVAIITGAARGLGYAIAKRMSREGAQVVLADIQGAEEAAATLRAQQRSVLACAVDVAEEESVAAMVSQARAAFGRVDILINNAAISADMARTPFEEITPAGFSRMMAVNALGPFLCCRAVAPIMRAQRSGRIINMVSGTAFRGAPYIAHYVASKDAVMSMTRSLAHELGTDNITVNAVSPGYTLTDSNLANADYLEATRAAVVQLRAIKRDAYPDDVTGAVLFLAGDDAKFITGQILVADGGAVYH